MWVQKPRQASGTRPGVGTLAQGRGRPAPPLAPAEEGAGQRASGTRGACYQWGRPLQRQLSGGRRRTARAHQTRLVAPFHAEETHR